MLNLNRRIDKVIIIIIKAFKESVLWGLGCLFLPGCSIVFVIMHWQDCKKPFLLHLLGGFIVAAGVGFMLPDMIKGFEKGYDEAKEKLDEAQQSQPALQP